MPAYAYSGLTAKGKPTKGVLAADNIGALKLLLKADGVFLTGVNETAAAAAKTVAAGGREVDLTRFFDRVSPKMVSQMTRLLGTLLRAGVTLPEALVALTEQEESPRFKGILADLGQRVNEGASLADSMSRHPRVFPPLYVNMVRAGEASGALETILDRLADFQEKQLELQSKVTSAMVYPIILSVLGVVIVAVLMIFIVPKITGMFEDLNTELPWNTRLLIWSSGVIASWWWLMALMAVGTSWMFGRWRATESGRRIFDAFALSIPVIGDLVRKIAITRFARTLATLLQSGVQFLDALNIVQSLLGNASLERVVGHARDNIREGEGISPALKRSGEFPPLVTHMIAVGERSGQLEEMLGHVADTYERETSTAIDRMSVLLEPLMIVAMGVSVGFVMFSIMQPIMMLNEMAGGG